MKMFTSSDQTAKLIELGFEEPSSIASVEPIYGMGGISVAKAYTIGELIEMLPQVIEFGEKWVFYPLHVMPTVGGGWAISYCKEYDERNNELIDALYDMIIKLKEEGVI